MLAMPPIISVSNLSKTYGSGFKTKTNRLSEPQKEALNALKRQALHAAILGFEHPRSGEFMRFESPLPVGMAALLQALRVAI